MELKVNRIDIKSGSFKLIAWILGSMLFLLLITFILIGEYWGVLVPIGFAFIYYLFMLLIQSEKVIFKHDEVIESHFGKVKKRIRYKEIVEITGQESGVGLVKLFSNEKIDPNAKISHGRGYFMSDLDINKIEEHKTKFGNKFILISKIEIPNNANPLKFIRDKNVILMNFNNDAYDFLRNKNLIN
jgi:hypothetical protein